MELLGLIALLWLIGCLFPGGGEPHYGPGWREVCGFLVGAAALVALFLAWAYSMVGLMKFGEWAHMGDWWIIICLLGPIAGPMLICATVNGIVEWRARAVAK